MLAATTFTKTGAKSKTTTKLAKEVFGVMPKDYTLLKEAYLAYLANGRQNSATTKTRAEVRGGGRKPWRQKGTGKARAGSIRSPIWRGGGITFGPRGSENYTKKIPKRAKLLALRQAFSLKAKEKAVAIIEDLDIKKGKTKEAKALLEKINADRRVLLLVEDKSDLLDRATRNLPNVDVRKAAHINVYAVVNADRIVVTKPALKAIEQRLATTAKEGKNV